MALEEESRKTSKFFAKVSGRTKTEENIEEVCGRKSESRNLALNTLTFKAC